MRQVSKLYGKASALEGNVAVSMKAAAKTATGVKSATTTSAGTMASQTAISQKERKRQDRKREREKERQGQQQQVAGARQAREYDESSSDSETECICADVSIPVVFCNMQSVNPLNRSGSMENKFDRLKSVIQRNNPAIVALVETWLNDKHDNAFVLQRLGLQNYQIFRQDRKNGHHEGINMLFLNMSADNY